MNFLFLGMFGVMMELTFVAFRDLIRGKNSLCLRGDISLWMFLVYAIGLTYGFDLIKYLTPLDTLRYLSYPFWIWMLEIIIAYPLNRFNIRLWNYDYLPDKCHWKGYISFVHYPVWVFFGYMVELVKMSI